ncbi:MAG: GatB/YqeY domain-containing protein [Nitrospirae bacterium]|nr:GatB/YqeY domain-containing protein [Nitrospirota bacterium]
MSLIDRLAEDIKTTMKAKDQLRLDVIRMAKAALMNREIELKGTLDDAESARVLVGLVKQRKEAVEQFQKGQRPDLADKELKEIAIIETYLPKALSQDEVRKLVEAVIAETGATSPKDMGNVMKAVMARLAGQTVDGKVISDLVRGKLTA